MTEEQKMALDEEINQSDKEQKKLFIAKCGITSQEATQYAYSILNQVFGLRSQATGILITESSRLLFTMGGTAMHINQQNLTVFHSDNVF